MKRITYIWLAALTMAGAMTSLSTAQQPVAADPVAGSSAQEQPLGDYARNVRKDRKPAAAKKFDNDNLPMEDKLSVVGPPPQAASEAQGSQDPAAPTEDASANAAKDAAKPAKLPSVTPDQSPQERQQVYSQWQDKISAQKDRVDMVSRELDLLQREYRLRAAEVYNDAGSRLRSEQTWDKEDADYKKKLDDKQKELNEVKEGMDTLQEDARKAGIPNSARESAAQGSSAKAADTDHN